MNVFNALDSKFLVHILYIMIDDHVKTREKPESLFSVTTKCLYALLSVEMNVNYTTVSIFLRCS